MHLLLLLISLLPLVNATSYFVSISRGNDANAGTSMSAPWQSMDRVYNVVASSARSGDSIYFCINERWTYSMIDANVAGISYGAYDCVNQRLLDASSDLPKEQRPQITPAIDLIPSRWSISSTNPSINQSVPMLQYDFSNDPVIIANGLASLWVNGVRYHLARYPNIVDPVNEVTWGMPGEFLQMVNITDSAMYYRSINQPSNQLVPNLWAGCRLHFRQANWIYFESFVVSSSVTRESSTQTMNRIVLDRTWGTQGTLQFHMEAHPNGRYPRHRQLIDQVGEFLLDQSTKTLYLIPLDRSTADRILAGTLSVSGLYGNGGSGAFIRQRNINITNLEFTQSNGGIILQSGGANIQQTSITHVLGTAFMQSAFQTNVQFIDNYVDDSEATCVTAVGATVLIARNSINRCGMYARTATTNSNPAWNGITITSGVVRDNEIKGCGYTCVAPHAGATVDSNYIENAMMTLNDGGAIYTYGSYDNYAKITNNIIKNVKGNYLSYVPNGIAPCIYLDEGTTGSLVQNNSCIGATHCVYLNVAFSHNILMNDCQCPGLHQSKGSGHLYAGNLVVSHGTNGQWQNPIVRVREEVNQNYNGILTMFDQAYCIKGTGYMFQRQTVNNTWRYDNFELWKAAEIPYNPNWERGSRGVTSCDGWKPVDYNSADPWAFLKVSSSSSSSTGTIVIKSSSSSVVAPIHSSSSVVAPIRSSSTGVASTAQPVVQSSSAGFTPSSSSSAPVVSISSSTPVSATCSFAGPFKQPSTKLTLNLRFASFVTSTLDLLFKDVDRWFESRGHIDLAWRVNLQCGSFEPISQSSRRRLLASSEQTYQLVFYIVDYELAAEASAEFMTTVNSPTGWRGEMSDVQSIAPTDADLVAQQQCDDGSNVSLYAQCPSAVPADDTSSSSSSSAAIGGAIGGVIGGLLLLAVVVVLVRSYRKRMMSSTVISPRASPQSSPQFNVLKGSPASSPRLDAGVTLERLSSAPTVNTQSNDQSDLTPRFELSSSRALFLQMPPSPMSSSGYSPSASNAAYNMMPASPLMLHPQTNNQASKQPTPPTEYYRMPVQGLQLPKGRPVTFSKPLPDPTVVQSNNQSSNQPMTARVHSNNQSNNQTHQGSMSARVTPPLPGNKPIAPQVPGNKPTITRSSDQPNSRTPSRSPPSTARPALPMTRPNVNKI